MAEELRILYEDPYLVVCVKPVGVLSEDSESGRSLPRMLAEHYRQAGKPTISPRCIGWTRSWEE